MIEKPAERIRSSILRLRLQPPANRRQIGLRRFCQAWTPVSALASAGPKGESVEHSGRHGQVRQRLLERAVPAWEQAQQRASELLGPDGLGLLAKMSKKLGMLKVSA